METSGRETAEERILLARAQAGDDHAFEQLFAAYQGLLTNRIRRGVPAAMTRKLSVSDVVQEVRITAHRRLGEFRPRSEHSFRSWLMKIAEFKVGAVLKRFGKTAKRAVAAEVTRGRRSTTAQFRAGGPSPSQAACAAEDRDLVHRALELLPDDYRCVLRLVYVEQLNLREAGERMGRSADAARKLYGRALARFTDVVGQLRGANDG
jgi:RNA polymerase sigma-70 factor (ECF subfamily)